MQNNLKPVSKTTIQELNECDMRTIMATGDNLLTAASVAKKCLILKPNIKVYCGDIAVSKDSGKSFIDWQVIKAES